MVIKTINKRKYGNRVVKDDYYQTTDWKRRRHAFRLGFTIVNNHKVPNTCCIECFIQTGKLVDGTILDHIIQRKAGGTDNDDNLQTLCNYHHAVKSAREGNAMRSHQK